MSRRTFLKAVGAMPAMVALSACVSLLPTPETPTALYRLPSLQATPTPLGANIIIREPEAPRILAGQEIAAVGGDGALRLVEGVEWADASTRLLQVALIDVLNLNGAGFALSPNVGGRAAYELDWRVSELSVQGQRASCGLELTVLDGRNRSPLARLSVRQSARADSRQNRDRVAALVSATQAALQEAAEALAQEISQRGEADPA